MPQIDQILDLFGNERGLELVIAAERPPNYRKMLRKAKRCPPQKGKRGQERGERLIA
jgi:hypothetical protein